MFATLWLLTHRCGKTRVSGWSTLLGQVVHSRLRRISASRPARSRRLPIRARSEAPASSIGAPCEGSSVDRIATGQRHCRMQCRADGVRHAVLPLQVVQGRDAAVAGDQVAAGRHEAPSISATRLSEPFVCPGVGTASKVPPLQVTRSWSRRPRATGTEVARVKPRLDAS